MAIIQTSEVGETLGSTSYAVIKFGFAAYSICKTFFTVKFKIFYPPFEFIL
jgi:hypothetical protein